MRYLFILLLLCGSVLAKTPVDYNEWQVDDTTYIVRLGGELSNYPDTDSTFASIDNDYIAEGDSVYKCNTSILKTRINDNGVATVKLTWDSTTYEVKQIPRKLIWINTQTKNWVNIVSSLSWSEPTKDSNIVKWNFPGFDYSLIKGNAQVKYQINFKKAFLDSAIVLYNQRSDSQYIALGNVHEYTFTNIDDSTLIDIAEVNMKRLKKFGKYTFNLSKQNLQWNGSDTSSSIPVRQRWVKVNNKIYCIEFVMMSDVKKVHEDYPNSDVWHNAETTIGASDIEDAYVNRWDGSGNNNRGGDDYYQASYEEAVYLIKFDLSGISGTVTAVSCSMKVVWSAQANDYHIKRMTTDWTEGVESGAPVTSGNPGATFNYATDYYTGEGTDVGWSGTGFSTADYVPASTSTGRDTAAGVASYGWAIFDNANMISDIDDMADGTYSIHSFTVYNYDGTSDRMICSTEHATTGNRPRLCVTYTAGGASASSQIMRLNIIGD